MKPKKYPQKDLNGKSALYFVFGLLIILALIYIALEWKVVDDNGGFDLGYSVSVVIN